MMLRGFYPEQTGRMEFPLTEVWKDVGGVCLQDGYWKPNFEYIKFEMLTEASSVFFLLEYSHQ